MGSSKQRIIQWNCRGIRPRYEELLLLLTLLRPSVFCLQETYLKPEDTFTFKSFNTYNYIHSDCLRASGGSSIFVHSSCPQREIKLKTDLQAVAVSLEKEITLCSIYIPPSFALRPIHLNSLLQQLPWYNDDCKEAIKHRKDTLSKFCKFPTKDNLNTYRVFRAKARRTIKSSKRKSWRTYVSNLNYKTPIKKVWGMVRKISGKSKAASHQHLNSNFNGGAETKATTKKDIADTLGDAFSKNSSNSNYPKEFQNYQKHQEKIKLNFKSSNNEEYNNPFNLDELKDAINKSHDTATGPDEIHYQMLKHLPPKSLKTLLAIFNDIWETGNFPESWELATIIPIPKPGKDHAEPTNYRPIALTSCICKTLERMINTRLVWYLEFNNLISPVQSGFRSERSTNDNLVRLETFIRDAFVKKEHVVAVFFDLEKAYDTTWKYGILRDLHEFGVKGRLANFVERFL